MPLAGPELVSAANPSSQACSLVSQINPIALSRFLRLGDKVCAHALVPHPLAKLVTSRLIKLRHAAMTFARLELR